MEVGCPVDIEDIAVEHVALESDENGRVKAPFFAVILGHIHDCEMLFLFGFTSHYDCVGCIFSRTKLTTVSIVVELNALYLGS